MLQLHPFTLLFRFVREPRHVISAAIFQHEHARFFPIGDRLFSQQDEFAASNLVCKLWKSDSRPGATHRYKPGCPNTLRQWASRPVLIFFHMSKFPHKSKNFSQVEIFSLVENLSHVENFHMSKIFDMSINFPPSDPARRHSNSLRSVGTSGGTSTWTSEIFSWEWASRPHKKDFQRLLNSRLL